MRSFGNPITAGFIVSYLYLDFGRAPHFFSLNFDSYKHTYIRYVPETTNPIHWIQEAKPNERKLIEN
jgi:hypothetical protein